jgi:Tfp pilus assembly protein PilF
MHYSSSLLLNRTVAGARRTTHLLAATLTPLSLALALGGCATSPPVEGPSLQAGRPIDRGALAAALNDDQPQAARQLLTAALRAEPQNGYLHLLNGLHYQLADGSQRSTELAQVGYDAAVKFAPGYYWSHYYAGLAKFGQKDYAGAAEEFAWAVLDRPDTPQAFVGLAAAAYFGGDLGVASLAAGRALALGPNDPQALRTSAYVAAASGDTQQMAQVLERANALPSGALAAHRPRLAQLLRTASQMAPAQQPPANQEPSARLPADSPPPSADAPQQVMVEVTLLLSQDTSKHSVGINLLDGLKLQFGTDRRTERHRGSSAADTLNRVLTSALTVPQITYSLNLFNTHDDFYDVVVRPSLVASLGQQSEFFIGRTMSVAVSGINAGALQTIDIGTSVKLTPMEISRERTKFRVDTVRSFFVPTSSGTFQESVTTFKQTVGATAEVEFGKTLILSGLYEAVNVGWTSKVPVLGDIPVGNVLFNERQKTQSRDAAIVLVTPRLAGTIDTDTREFRAETLSRLLSVWRDTVDPLANMDALTSKIRRKLSRHFGPQQGDLQLRPAREAQTARQAISETLARAFQD